MKNWFAVGPRQTSQHCSTTPTEEFSIPLDGISVVKLPVRARRFATTSQTSHETAAGSEKLSRPVAFPTTNGAAAGTEKSGREVSQVHSEQREDTLEAEQVLDRGDEEETRQSQSLNDANDSPGVVSEMRRPEGDSHINRSYDVTCSGRSKKQQKQEVMEADDLTDHQVDIKHETNDVNTRITVGTSYDNAGNIDNTEESEQTPGSSSHYIVGDDNLGQRPTTEASAAATIAMEGKPKHHVAGDRRGDSQPSSDVGFPENPANVRCINGAPTVSERGNIVDGDSNMMPAPTTPASARPPPQRGGGRVLDERAVWVRQTLRAGQYQNLVSSEIDAVSNSSTVVRSGVLTRISTLLRSGRSGATTRPATATDTTTHGFKGNTLLTRASKDSWSAEAPGGLKADSKLTAMDASKDTKSSRFFANAPVSSRRTVYTTATSSGDTNMPADNKNSREGIHHEGGGRDGHGRDNFHPSSARTASDGRQRKHVHSTIGEKRSEQRREGGRGEVKTTYVGLKRWETVKTQGKDNKAAVGRKDGLVRVTAFDFVAGEYKEALRKVGFGRAGVGLMFVSYQGKQ